MDSVNQSVIKKFETRQSQGFVKYGQTMDRADLSKLDWLKHAQEEAMDLVLYLEKLMQLESGTTAKVDTSVPARVITGKDIMPFGKHQGKFLEDVPSHYLAWILENVDGYEDLKLYIVDRIKNQ